MSGPRGERGPSGAPGGALAVVHRLDVVFAARGDEAPLRTLEDVSLRIDPGEFVALVGPSGSGKSTLVRAIAGLLPGSAHAVAHDDATDPVCVATRPDPRRPGGRVRDVAWMGQKDALLPWRRALDNAAVGARLAGASPTKARRDVAELMERFGLGGFERAWPHELSGGMRQRLALARTVLAGRRLLLLDEPFSGLDALTRREMNAWLRETDLVSPTDGAVVLVTHDVDEALTLADRVVVLSARPGRVVDELRAGAPAGHEAAALRARLLELLGVPAA